jgi:predicted nucleic acid-binding protein
MRYVDTSVLVAYLTREPSSAAAEAFMLSQGDPLAVSTWTEVELLSALGNKLRNRLLTSAIANGAVEKYDQLICPNGLQIAVTNADHIYAAKLLHGWRSSLRAGDSLHLAIAAKRGASIYTLDRGMNKAGNALGISVVLLQ